MNVASTPFSAIVMVFVSAFLGSFGSVLLKSGANRADGLRNLILNPRLAAGVVVYLVSSYFFVTGITMGELTILYPMVALGYIFTLLWSRLFFGEPITPKKIIGIFLILCGIGCLGLGRR